MQREKQIPVDISPRTVNRGIEVAGNTAVGNWGRFEPSDDSKENGRHDQADPEAWKDSQETLPQVPSSRVSDRTSGDQVATYAEEAIDGKLSVPCPINCGWNIETSKWKSMGD